MEKITLNSPSHDELSNIAKSCGIILCRRGHEASKEAVYEFVSDLISDASVLAQYASRSTILAKDIIYSLKISSNRLCNQLGTFYGSCNVISDAESEEDEDVEYIPPSHSEVSESTASSSSVSETSDRISGSGSEEEHFVPVESVELDGFSINSTSMQIYGTPEEGSPISLASIADVINAFCRKRSLVIRIQLKGLEVLKDVVAHHLSLSYSGQLSFIHVTTPSGGTMQLDTVNYLLSSPAIMPTDVRRDFSSTSSSASTYSASRSSLYSSSSSSCSSTSTVRRRLEVLGSAGSEVMDSVSAAAKSSTEMEMPTSIETFELAENGSADSTTFAMNPGSLMIAPGSPDWETVKNTLFASPLTPHADEFTRAAMELATTPGFDLPLSFERNAQDLHKGSRKRPYDSSNY